MDSRHSSSDDEGEYNDKDFIDHFDLEADKNRIVEHSPKGRFIRFNEELGSGAYKTVYKGYDNETGCEIAWNVIKLPKLPPKERKRISDEIALLKKLKHPNIISFISAWINKQKEEIVFITEVVTGGSLKKYLKKIKSPRLKVLKSWCREILQGIDYLHSLKPHPIIHRDIKCDNIFINSNKGEIRIGDLGLATLMSNAYAASVLGTPEFMAPEMYDEVYGPSVDIYSFGMCLLEMVTNQTPYSECMNAAQIYKKVINGVKPASLDLIVNDEVKNFICDCLKPRDERPSAKDLINHAFLQITDQEADNQPVALLEPLMQNIIQDEAINSTKPERNILKRQDINELEEGSDEKNESLMTSNKEVSRNYKREDGQQEKLNRKSSECVSPDEKNKESIPKQLGKFKSLENINMSSISTKVVDKEIIEDTKLDNYQEKVNISLHNKQSQFATNKEQIKYSFTSKGIINGHLIIVIKVDIQGHQYEHIVEIRRDKISYEKITRKLQKHLNFLPDINDLEFLNQIKALFESLDYLNITNFMPSVLPPLNSATSIAKSPSNGNFDIHSNYEKNNNPIFQSQLFVAFYESYIAHLYREFSMNESEEAMALRQQGELLELQNRHLLQRKNLWDKKHNILSNSTVAIYSLPSQTIETEDVQNRLNQIYDSNFKPCENKIKESGQNNFFFSPLSSGPLSPTMSGENLCSANISVEIMASLLKKLGNTLDEQNKSTSHPPDIFSENDKIQKSNIASPNNLEIINKTNDKGGNVFKFPNQMNTVFPQNVSNQINSTQKNTQELVAALSNKISPKNHNVSSSVTSPKDIPVIIGSPKGIKNYVYSSQNVKTTPLKSVSDKEDIYQRKQDKKVCLVIDEKDEEKPPHLPKVYQSRLPLGTGCQGKRLDVPNKELRAQYIAAKKEARYGSLTINTDIANQTDNIGQLSNPSQAQSHKQITQRRDEEVKKPETPPDFSCLQKSASDPHRENHNIKPEETLKHSNSLPRTCPNNALNNCQIKQTNNKDHAFGTPTAQPSVPKTLNHAQSICLAQLTMSHSQDHQVVPQRVDENNLGNKAQPYCTQQKLPTPKATINNEKILLGSPKATENIDVSAETLNYKIPNHHQDHLSQKEENSIKRVIEAKIALPTQNKQQPTYELVKTIKAHKLSHTLGRQTMDNNIEDIKILQLCLELLTGQEVNGNGNFGHYTENLVKAFQEKAGLQVDGVVNPHVWEKMICNLEKMEKKWMTKEYMKQKEIDDIAKDREDLKKKIKDKQNKEASESLTKIESKLVDLSSLL